MFMDCCTTPPKVCVSVLVNSLKGESGRMIRQKNDPSIRTKLWSGALRSPSDFAGSCGDAPIAVIRLDFEQRHTPHSPPHGTLSVSARSFPALKKP